MITELRRRTKDWLDRPMTSWHLILAIFALLLGFGLLMVLSSSAVTSYRKGGTSFTVFRNQATYAVLGILVFYAALRMPVRLIRTLSTSAVIVSLGLLVAVLVPGIGKETFGARSWIVVGSAFQFQPAEIAKLSLLLWAAHVLAARRSTLGSMRSLLIPILPVAALMVLLIMMQPDLGTTATLALVLLAVLWFGGAPGRIFAALAVIGVGGIAVLAVTANYRLLRVLSYLDPEAHPDDSYQLLQGLYGMGNGGWFGVGLGGSRAKWSWLPNADSDFIFAIIGEELGLVGTGIVLLLFGLLAYTGMRIARRNVDPFVKIVAASSTVWLVGQAAINIGYVVGLLPVTGLTLPMISTGGTSLIITMGVFGLLANFSRREPQAAGVLHSRGPGTVARFLGLGAPKVRAPKAHQPKARPVKSQPPPGRVPRSSAPPAARPPSRPGPRPVARPPARNRQTFSQWLGFGAPARVPASPSRRTERP